MIGDGPERPALERLAAQLGVAARVDWADSSPHEDALRELAGCHLMALPSVDEAFGVAYVEALACGVPAIGCRGEGGPEEIAARARGWCWSRRATRTRWPRPSPSCSISRAPRGARRRPHAPPPWQQFSWERCGEATVAAYERALAEGPR